MTVSGSTRWLVSQLRCVAVRWAQSRGAAMPSRHPGAWTSTGRSCRMVAAAVSALSMSKPCGEAGWVRTGETTRGHSARNSAQSRATVRRRRTSGREVVGGSTGSKLPGEGWGGEVP